MWEIFAALDTLLRATVPKMMGMVLQDLERELVITILEQLKRMVDQVGASVFYDKTIMDEMITIIKQVIHRKVGSQSTLTLALYILHREIPYLEQTKCQDNDEEVQDVGDADDEEEEAEYDSMLIENAGELLPSIVKVVGGENFQPHFQEFIHELTKKAVRPTSTSV